MDKGLDYIINIKNGNFGGAAKIKAELLGLDNVVLHTNEVITNLSKVVGKAGSVINGDFNIKGVGSVIEKVATTIGGNSPSSLSGAAMLVSSALQSPMKSLASLQSIAGRFNEAQKDAIATETKSSGAHKNEGAILQQLQTVLGKSKQSVHDMVGPVGDLKGSFDKLQGGLTGLINNGFKVATPLLSEVKKITDALTTAQEILTVTQEGLAAAQEVLTVGQWALNVAMDANPVGLIIAGIAALAAGVYVAYQKSETFRAVLAGVGEVAEELMPIFKGLGEIIIGAFTLNPAMVVAGFTDAANGVQKLIEDGGISGAFNKGFDKSKAESAKADKEEQDKENQKAGKVSNVVTPAGKKGSPFENKQDKSQVLAKNQGKGNPLARASEKPVISGGVSKGLNKTQGGSQRGAQKTFKEDVSAAQLPKKLAREATSLAGGGKGAVHNVQITISKLVERLEIHTTNIQSISASEIKKQITALLVGAVHDSGLALGSQ